MIIDLLYALISIVPILCLTAIAIVISHYHWKEYRLDKKVDMISHLVDKDYETDNIDLDKL